MQNTMITQAAETAAEELVKSKSPDLTGLIVLIVLLVVCAAAYIIYRQMSKNNGGSKEADAKTAQDLINVFDLGDNCLYTVDGMCFMYIKIDGIPLEMFEQQKLLEQGRSSAKNMVSIKFPWKFESVSRPMDIRETLQNYTDLQEISSPGHKALLQQEINELLAMTNRGETNERQHYAVIWCRDDKEYNIELKKRAETLVKIFSENKIRCEILNKEDIYALLKSINTPSHSNIEARYDFSDDLLRAIIR